MTATDSAERPRATLPDRPRILVVRFSALGDVLLTFPAVTALRHRWPQARIGYLTDVRLEGLLEGLPAVDNVITLDRVALKKLSPRALGRVGGELLYPLRRGQWDVVLDLQGFGETGWLAVWSGAPMRVGRRGRRVRPRAYVPFIDVPPPDCYMTGAHLDTLVRAGLLAEVDRSEDAPQIRQPFFAISDAATAEWSRRSEQMGLSPSGAIGLFIGAARAEKRWPVERFAELAAALAGDRSTDGRPILVFGGPQDDERVRRVIEAAGLPTGHVLAAGTGSLGALAAAWRDCAVVVSNDTGPMHLSVAVGTPTVGIFLQEIAHFTPPPPHRSIIARAGKPIGSIDATRVQSCVEELVGTQGVGATSS